MAVSAAGLVGVGTLDRGRRVREFVLEVVDVDGDGTDCSTVVFD